ncbi:uncharacterized protein LOC112571889 isoform X2 [Pomacea canaliculata]|uniref:uncharacterized protein LOC112571889 isoform X2 n=1 Tax=Pomacea canaliculata TaxID=400727 RepID=UPI000D733063|nr:uncharacterized protein LOC112571889 isoform X2 [Pomacea canaliculata]
MIERKLQKTPSSPDNVQYSRILHVVVVTTMRVHLRGVVISVGVLLSLVVMVAVFNAYDSSSSSQVRGRQPGRSGGRMALRAADDSSDAAASGSRAKKSAAPRARSRSPDGDAVVPSENARLGPSGRTPGMASRGGGGPARPGMASRGDNLDRPAMGARGANSARGGAAGGAGARFGSRNEETSDTLAARPRGGSRQVERMDQDEAVGTTTASKPARGKARGGSPNSKGSKRQANEETVPAAETSGKSRQPKYPEWWEASYPRSAVNGLEETFVGDGPLFPECATTQTVLKLERFGFVEPPNYMTNSKNPCWFENIGKKDLLRCVPYFYIAGVAECGTSDLMTRLLMHPNVMRGSEKAYHWWDRLRYGASATLRFTREHKRTENPVSVKDYARNVVGDSGRNLTRELLYQGKSQAIFGDASPTYMVENTQWDIFAGNDGCLEPRIVPGSFIKHMYPDTRIIIMLRQPVYRLYSRFLARIPNVEEFENATSSLFHTFLVQAVQNYMACFARFSIRQCAYNTSLFINSVVRLSEGMYPIFLEDWLRIFPPEHFMIIRYEDYVQDIEGHLKNVFEFLGLEPLDHSMMLKIVEAPVSRKGPTPEDAGYMLQESVKILTDFYSPFLSKLAHMLNDKKWLFEDVPPPPVATYIQQTYPQQGREAPPAVAETEAKQQADVHDDQEQKKEAEEEQQKQKKKKQNQEDDSLDDNVINDGEEMEDEESEDDKFDV